MSDFSEASLRGLLTAIQDRATGFAQHIDTCVQADPERPQQPIYLRFDVDDNFRKAYQMSCICNEYGIKATFFILNTAPYWNNEGLMESLKVMQDKGHEIGWHNNILTEWHQVGQKTERLPEAIGYILNKFQSQGIQIRGSASHGDPLCHKLGYLNYEVFKECPRTEEAIDFPKPSFTIPQVSMHEFGLEYEAYHVPHDLYLSESGGRQWTWRAGECYGNSFDTNLINKHDRIQILIHPQHWKI